MNLRIDTSITYVKGYTLEVQKYTKEKWKKNPGIQKFKHKGYMQCLFRTRKQAAAYYDYWNPHLRPLNYHGTYCSQRDPDTDCRYVVRKFFRETQTIPPFDEKDLPKYATSTKSGKIVAITTIYPKYEYLESKKKFELPKIV